MPAVRSPSSTHAKLLLPPAPPPALYPLKLGTPAVGRDADHIFISVETLEGWNKKKETLEGFTRTKLNQQLIDAGRSSCLARVQKKHGGSTQAAAASPVCHRQQIETLAACLVSCWLLPPRRVLVDVLSYRRRCRGGGRALHAYA